MYLARGSFLVLIGTIKKGQVATLGVTYEQGIKWAQALEEGATFNATAWVDSYVKNAKTLNIIAQTTAGDPENVVMLGAHSDSVAAGPGINDDGSGSISLLEVATALTNYTVNNQVRFAWWAAEEEGLLGSDYYVSQLTPEENSKIRVFMDYDMMASPNFAYQVYDANNEVNPPGSGELKQLYIDYYNSQGVNHTSFPLTVALTTTASSKTVFPVVVLLRALRSLRLLRRLSFLEVLQVFLLIPVTTSSATTLTMSTTLLGFLTPSLLLILSLPMLPPSKASPSVPPLILLAFLLPKRLCLTTDLTWFCKLT